MTDDHFACYQSAVDFANAVDRELGAIRDMLVAKNAYYGNSALEPLRVFSRADAVEQIKVRIDDKLSRLMRGNNAGEDTVLDLIGYLVLLRIAQPKLAALQPLAPRGGSRLTEPELAEDHA